MAPRTPRAVSRHETSGLVLRATPYGESDLVVALFTEELGKLSALARAARASKKRFAGSLEPFHGLQLELSERVGSEMLVVESATLAAPRLGLLHDLERVEAAGTILRWVREAAPVRVPEPAIWQELNRGLDELARADAATKPETARRVNGILAHTGLRLTRAFGWALELDACAACGRPCPPEKSARVSAGRGGVICRNCGGGELLIPGPLRGRLVAISSGADVGLSAAESKLVLELVRDALRAHGNLETDDRKVAPGPVSRYGRRP